MGIIFDAANTLINNANKDEELREWFKSQLTRSQGSLSTRMLSFLRLFTYSLAGPAPSRLRPQARLQQPCQAAGRRHSGPVVRVVVHPESLRGGENKDLSLRTLWEWHVHVSALEI